MIASHMIACLFTELNQNQVQKVSQHGRGRLAPSGPSGVLPGNVERTGDLLPPPTGLGTWNSLGSWGSPEREKPRLLAPSWCGRAPPRGPPPRDLRALSPSSEPRFPHGRVALHVVLDRCAHVGGAPRQPEFRPSTWGRTQRRGGGAAGAGGSWGRSALRSSWRP